MVNASINIDRSFNNNEIRCHLHSLDYVIMFNEIYSKSIVWNA